MPHNGNDARVGHIRNIDEGKKRRFTKSVKHDGGDAYHVPRTSLNVGTVCWSDIVFSSVMIEEERVRKMEDGEQDESCRRSRFTTTRL